MAIPPKGIEVICNAILKCLYNIEYKYVQPNIDVDNIINKGNLVLITNSEGNIFNDKFSDLASSSNNITIASGYFGASQLEEVKPIFLDIAKIGEVKLIHGMGMWEGKKKP